MTRWTTAWDWSASFQQGCDGPDVLIADEGDDFVDGPEGNDRVRPVAGDAMVEGEAGQDVFLPD
jgi:hypothetical protein